MIYSMHFDLCLTHNTSDLSRKFNIEIWLHCYENLRSFKKLLNTYIGCNGYDQEVSSKYISLIMFSCNKSFWL